MSSSPSISLRAPRSDHVASSGIEPEEREIAALLFATLLTVILYWSGAYGAVSLLGPLMLCALGSWGMWRLLRRTPAGIWTPLFSLRAATVVYLGIGSLAGGEWATDFFQRLYAYSPQEEAKANTVFMVGYFVVIASIKLASLVHPAPVRSDTGFAFSLGATLKLGLLFFLAGLGFILFVYMPSQLLWIQVTVPGSLVMLFRALGGVGTFLIALWAVGRGGAAYSVLVAAMLIQLLLGLVLLEKTIILMTVLLVGIAFLLTKVTMRRLLVLVLALGVTLSVSFESISYARGMQVLIHGSLEGGTIGERLGHYAAFVRGERIGNTVLREQSSLIRLNYIAPATFVITQYDYGMPNEAIANGLYALIPRVIWPDKPILSAAGSELNRMMTGYDTTSMGVPVFADVYWNFGWVGLLLFVPMSGFLWWASYKSRDIVESRNWAMMPFVMVVFLIALSIDTPFVLSWLAPAVTSIILYFMLKVAYDVLAHEAR